MRIRRYLGKEKRWVSLYQNHYYAIENGRLFHSKMPLPEDLTKMDIPSFKLPDTVSFSRGGKMFFEVDKRGEEIQIEGDECDKIMYFKNVWGAKDGHFFENDLCQYYGSYNIGNRVSCHWRTNAMKKNQQREPSGEPSPGTIQSVDHSERTISITFDDGAHQTRIPLEWVVEPLVHTPGYLNLPALSEDLSVDKDPNPLGYMKRVERPKTVAESKLKNAGRTSLEDLEKVIQAHKATL